MAPRYVNKLALLAKPETVYGTDAVPTGSANAIQANDVTITQLGQEERRDLVLPYMGHQGVFLTGDHVQLEYSVEVAGAGAAGTVPKWGVLHRACGFAETINAGVSVEYEPVSSSFEGATHYYNLDGVRHILLGARGTWGLEMTPQRILRWRYRMLGLAGTIADSALPAVDHSGFIKPVIVSKANTTLSLHGYAGPMEAMSIDLANQLEPRLILNHESIQIVDRQSTGSVTVEAALLAAKNWFAIAKSEATGALDVQHGTTAGSIVEIDAGAVQLGRPVQGASQGIANYRIPLMFIGEDFKITVR